MSVVFKITNTNHSYLCLIIARRKIQVKLHIPKLNSYYSDKSVDELQADIQLLFNGEWGFFVNLDGEFTSEHEFKMSPLVQAMPIRWLETQQSFLYGSIQQNEAKRTVVTFSVRANSIFTVFFFLFPLIGLATWNKDSTISADKINEVALTFIFFVPSLMMAISYFLKRAIKNRFINTFDLKPISK